MTKFEFVLNKFYEITAWSAVCGGCYDSIKRRL